MGFVLALAALVIAVIDGATHGFTLVVLSIILLSVAVLLEGDNITTVLRRR